MAQIARRAGALYDGGKGIGISTPLAIALGSVMTIALTFLWTKVEKPAPPLAAPAGVPCPVASPTAFSQLPKPRQVIAVGGALLGRASGDVVCDVEGGAMQSAVGGGDHVLCQFSAPAALAIRTRRGEFDFAPAFGRVASIYISNGAPRCVLAAPYWASLTQSLTADMRAPAS